MDASFLAISLNSFAIALAIDAVRHLLQLATAYIVPELVCIRSLFCARSGRCGSLFSTQTSHPLLLARVLHSFETTRAYCTLVNGAVPYSLREKSLFVFGTDSVACFLFLSGVGEGFLRYPGNEDFCHLLSALVARSSNVFQFVDHGHQNAATARGGGNKGEGCVC